ncbi:MAG: hypothetical protein WBE26_20455 [Phycisphaerae bacterium]
MVLAGLGYVYLILFGLSLDILVAIPSDDAFYYFKIARNVVHGLGCTFDGIARTNGFHPFWMVCILPVFWLFGGDLEIPVRVILAFNGLVCITTLVLLYRIVHRHVAVGVGSVAAAVCLLPNILRAMTNGMETGLMLFALTCLLWLCYRKRIHDPAVGPGMTFLFGILVGIVCLCRLDTVFILAAAASLTVVYTLLRQITLRACLAWLIVVSGGFGLIVVPYLTWNLAYFGHIMPISGAIKSSFPLVRASLTLPYDMGFGAALLALLWLLMVVLVVIDSNKDRRLERLLASPVTMLTLACTYHFAYVFLFLTWGIYWWHFAVYGLTLAVALAQVVDRCTASRPHVRPAVIGTIAVAVTAVALALNIHESRIKGAQHRGWLEGAEWAREHTSPEAVFAIKDAGLFGYFSDRQTINLDGKANGYAYRSALRNNDVQGYLRRCDVDYVAKVSAPYNASTCWIVIPRVCQSPVILVMNERQEVFHSRAFTVKAGRVGRPAAASFGIWRFSEAGARNADG